MSAAPGLTANERARRRDLLSILRAKREELNVAISRSQHTEDRAGLLGASRILRIHTILL